MTRLFAGTSFDRPPHCDRCELPESDCRCSPLPTEQPECVPPEKQTARLAVEKRKRGKLVTVIRGLRSNETDLPALLKTLKNKCGAGGSMQGETLELQGRQLDIIRAVLQEIGYKVRG